MLPLTTPEDDAGDVFAAAARRTRDLDRRAALLGQRKYVAGRAAEYLRLARVNRLFSLKEMVPVGIAAKELENLYSRVLVNGGERPLYERLVGSAPRRMCPLCGQRDVGTLDHYLSKSVFPELSVFPANLVPACATCNHSKGSAQCLTAYEQLFHPYFDNWSKYRLLSAKIDIISNVKITFNIRASTGVPISIYRRARNHFDKLNLALLYEQNAAVELVGRKGAFQRTFADGAEAFREELDLQAKDWSSISLNIWQAALYRALAHSEDFYSGGFNNIE